MQVQVIRSNLGPSQGTGNQLQMQAQPTAMEQCVGEDAQVAAPEQDPSRFPDDDGPQRKAGKWLSDGAYEIAIAKEPQATEAQAKRDALKEDSFAAEAYSPLQEHEGDTEMTAAEEAEKQRRAATFHKMNLAREADRAATTKLRYEERKTQQSARNLQLARNLQRSSSRDRGEGSWRAICSTATQAPENTAPP